jgi:predicted dehydrogenase
MDKETEIIRLKNLEGEADPFAMTIDLGEGKGTKQIWFEKPEVKPLNAIRTELETFYNAIKNNNTPMVTIMDGYNSLEVAYSIIEKLNLAANF